MLQLGHAAAADFDEEGVGTGDVVALQHFLAVLHQFHQLVPVAGRHGQADEGIHVDPVGRAVEHYGIAADDAVDLQFMNAAGNGGAGQCDLLGDLLDRHPGIFGEQGEDLAV